MSDLAALRDLAATENPAGPWREQWGNRVLSALSPAAVMALADIVSEANYHDCEKHPIYVGAEVECALCRAISAFSTALESSQQ